LKLKAASERDWIKSSMGKGGLQLGIGSSHVLSKFILEIDTDPKDIERY